MLKLQSFVLGLLGALLGLAAGLWLRTGEPPVPRPSANAGADLAPILAELRSIRALLAAPQLEPLLEPLLEALPEDSRTETPVAATAPDSRELVAALRSLEATLLAARRPGDPLGSRAEGGPTSLRGEEARPIDIEEVRRVRATIEGTSGVRVDPALFGLSPAQLYGLLGTPTTIGTSPGRVRWIYDDPGYPQDLVVTFFDGYVAWVHLVGE